jgi:hypothetical protein
METHIVLIPVEYSNSRKVCEQIQNQKFKSVNEALIEITSKLDIESLSDILIYDMNNFMDVVNDQDLDVLIDFFMSYIIII